MSNITIEDVYQSLEYPIWKTREDIYADVAILYNKETLGFFEKRKVRKYMSQLQREDKIENCIGNISFEGWVLGRKTKEPLYRRKPEAGVQTHVVGGLEGAVS